VREVDGIVFVPLSGIEAALVGGGIADVANQAFKVVIVCYEVLSEGIQQFGIGSGIAGADIVNGVNDSTSEEIAPVAVHNTLSEVWVFRCCEPLGQLRAATGGGIYGSSMFEWEAGGSRLIGIRVDNWRCRSHGEDEFVTIGQWPTTDIGEPGGKFVVLPLSPAFEGVVMALIAVEAGAEEHLCHVLHDKFGFASDSEVIGCRVFEGISCRSDEFSSELVVGAIRGNLLADPVAERPDTAFCDGFAAIEQQITPFERPVFDVAWAVEQLFNFRSSFCTRFGGICYERVDFVDGGRNTGNVEADAAEEFGIAGGTRRQNFHALQLVVDQSVDEVLFGLWCPLVAVAISENGDRGSRVVPFIPHEGGGLTRA
jgi:hypothetical protein